MSGNDETVYVDQHFARAAVSAAAERAFTTCLEGVRESSYPGFWAIDFGSLGDAPLDEVLSHIEQDLGVRPLTLAQVDAMFDTRTGAPLAA